MLLGCHANPGEVADAAVLDAGNGDAASALALTLDTSAVTPPSGSFAQTEPAVAVSADGVLVVTWLDLEAHWALGYAFSHDHGASWEPSQLVTLPANLYASNETVQADADGNFHVLVLGVEHDEDVEHVLTAEAPAGTDRFGETLEVSDETLAVPRDAPAFVVASDGSLNVDWTEYTAHLVTSSIIAARSVDEGATWTRTPSLSLATDQVAWPNLCASKTGGQLTAIFENEYGVGMRWSTDNGATWPVANVNVLQYPGVPGEFPSCLQKGRDLWIMQGMAMNSASTTYEPVDDTIQLVHSGDGGFTFDPAVAAQDPAAGSAYIHPMGAFQFDGSISLIYYAGNGMDDTMASVRYSRSLDGGKTFLPSRTVFSPMTLTTSRVSLSWLGDLLGVTTDTDTLLTGYVDNSSGAAHVRVARLIP